MKLIIEINTDNAAFDNGSLGHEIARILRQVANTVASASVSNRAFQKGFNESLQDFSGNFVGKAIHGE